MCGGGYFGILDRFEGAISIGWPAYTATSSAQKMGLVFNIEILPTYLRGIHPGQLKNDDFKLSLPGVRSQLPC